jgi:hypothetical protein
MIQKVVDYSAGAETWSVSKCTSFATALHNAGYIAALRYLGSWPSGKGITNNELKAHLAAGNKVVFIMEEGTKDSLEGKPAAMRHTDMVKVSLSKLGIDYTKQPVIYCTDTDAHIGQVGPYYQAVGAIMGFSNTWAYGGYFLVKELFDAHLISGALQAKAWSTANPVTGSQYYGIGRVVKWEPRAQLRQHGEGVTTITIDGTLCNDDRAYSADYGQYPRTVDVPAYPMLRYGDKSSFVKMIQTRLNEKGYIPKLEVDGDFGPKTLAAVKWFQTKMRIEIDGIVGPITWSKLLN